jgi:mRNA interferase MazF
MKKGDIVIIEFPFTDLVSTKLRPFVILVENRFDYVVCFITSNLKIKESCDLILRPTSINGLKAESLLKINKIMTIDKSLVKGKIGHLTISEINLVNKNIVKLFSLK